MKKRFWSYLKYLFIALFLGGCLNYTQVTTVKKDKTGDMFIHWWIKWNTIEDTTALSRIHIFKPDTIRSRFESKFTTIDNMEIYTDFEEKTQHGKIKFEFSNFDSLVTLPLFINSDLSLISGPDETNIFSQFVQPMVSNFGINTGESKIKYIYYLPGKIVKHNANSHSRNKLTWEFSLEELGTGKEINATYTPFRLKETPKIIYYIACIVLIIVAIFLFKKRK